ncbi:hypothetical protein ACQKFE_21615, partial [Stutzerimonas stutzeri]|uniref:hypothetical protein n=1 Tax=Stutzerimonas stutzeri TaxID=316 RepID=UPI003D046EA8
RSAAAVELLASFCLCFLKTNPSARTGFMERLPMFAIYQGSQGMQDFAKQRSAEANQKAETQSSEQLEVPDDYIESLRMKEAMRRSSEAP